jgi:hypothetical protein
MTTDLRREPKEGAKAVDVLGDGQGRQGGDGPTATVPVIPLWERLRAGVRA